MESFSYAPRIILIRGCVWEVVLGHAKGCLKEGLHSGREDENVAAIEQFVSRHSSGQWRAAADYRSFRTQHAGRSRV